MVALVDGVSPGWILADDAELDLEGASIPPGACEVELRLTLSEAEGSGSGVTLEDAHAAARAEACRALGDDDCSDDDSYTLVARRQNTSVQINNGETTSTVTAEVTLRRTQTIRGEATSSTSRLDACRSAVARACGGDGCPAEPDGMTLTHVDGVSLAPPARSLFGL